MLSGLFNYDNPVWRFIGKFWDVMIVSWLWLICSIPIVTIGASTTAMYYVTLKLVRDEDGYTIRSFFRSFKENFKQSTVIWLLFLVVGFLLAGDLFFFYKIYDRPGNFRYIMMAVFLAFSIVYLCTITFVFPLQSRFYNTVKRTLFNALFMSLRHFFQTLGIIAIDVAMVVASLYFPILIFFGVGLIAFVNSFIFSSIFKKYMPKENEEEPEEELRPLFEDESEKMAKK